MNYPYLRKRNSSDFIRIEVMADSMRVGKTTAVQVLAKGLRDLGYNVTESYEDWQNNPYLKDSYSDPEKNFLLSQKWFIKRKWEQVKEGATGGIFIQDVSPEMDYCYAATNKELGRMSQENFKSYDKYYRSLDWTVAPSPHLLVYLQVSDKGLIERANACKREFETVESEYFLTMKKINRGWLSNITDDYQVLTINTDSLNFAIDEKAKETLIYKVRESIIF